MVRLLDKLEEVDLLIKMKLRYYILILILLLAAVMRLYRIGEFPLGLFGDEVDHGYNAFSISQTLKDYNGNWFPIHTESMGDRRPALYAWSLAPWVAVLGLSDWSVRLASAVYGMAEVFLIYWFVTVMLNTPTSTKLRGPLKRAHTPVALLSALVLAIVPWHVHFSRIGLEAVWTQMLLVLGVSCLVKSAILFGLNSNMLAKVTQKVSNIKYQISNKGNNRYLFWLVVGTVVLGLNAYSYQAAKLISPFLWFLTILTYWRTFKGLSRNVKLSVLGLLALILTPLFFDSFFRGGQDRFNSINVLNSPGLVEDINYARGQLDGQPELVKKVFHNKAVSAGYEIGNNYLSSFSPGFLFMHGDETNPRHSVPGFGMLYWWMVLPTTLGGLYLVSNIKHEISKILLIWLLVVPLSSAVTVGGAQHGIRLFSMLPPLVIMTGVGLYISGKFLRNNYKIKLKHSGFVLFLVALISVIYYGQIYLFHYSQTEYEDWQYGFKEAVRYVENHKNEYDQVIITKSYAHLPMLHYVFYSQFAPYELHELFAGAEAGLNLPPTDRIGKISFATINTGDVYKPQNTLYIAAPWDRTEGWNQIGEVNSPDPMNNPPVLLFLSSK